MVTRSGYLCRVSLRVHGKVSWQIALQKRVALAKLQGRASLCGVHFEGLKSWGHASWLLALGAWPRTFCNTCCKANHHPCVELVAPGSIRASRAFAKFASIERVALCVGFPGSPRPGDFAALATSAGRCWQLLILHAAPPGRARPKAVLRLTKTPRGPEVAALRRGCPWICTQLASEAIGPLASLSVESLEVWAAPLAPSAAEELPSPAPVGATWAEIVAKSHRPIWAAWVKIKPLGDRRF